MEDNQVPAVNPEINPAHEKAIDLPPQLVELCQNDPEILVALARGQLAVVQHLLVRKALAADVSVAQLAAVHERLTKVARIEGDKQAGPAGGGQQVVINIIRAPGKEQVTIEGQAQRVEAT